MHRFMVNFKVRDIKKALRLCGWVLVRVDGCYYYYRHPNVRVGFSIKGRDNDEVAPAQLLLFERQLGLCLCPVLA